MKNDDICWERVAAILICIMVGLAFLFLFVRYLLPLLFPFLLAWGIAIAVRPLARRISKRFSLSEKLCSVFLLFVFLVGGAWGIGWAVSRLIRELRELVAQILQNNGGVEGTIANALEYLERLTVNVGKFSHIAIDGNGNLGARISDLLSHLLENLISAVSAGIPNILGTILSALPSLFLVTLVTVIASVYFCIDGDRVGRAILSLLPNRLRVKIPAYIQQLRQVSWKYARAYLLLLGLTVIELFLGFCILRVDYAFLLALIIAVVDMLPILGVGTVLIPWALVALIQKNAYLGFGLLILYAAVLILRQIFEPRLVGKSLGLHPLLTLFAGYVGWKLFGFLGMAFGPIFALLVKTLITQWSRIYKENNIHWDKKQNE